MGATKSQPMWTERETVGKGVSLEPEEEDNLIEESEYEAVQCESDSEVELDIKNIV